MSFVKVANIRELNDGEKKKVVVNGVEILISNIDGEYYAISNKCTHMGGSLGEGTLVGGIITCPKHGAKFDVRTGKKVGDAKIAFLKIKVKDDGAYAVKIEGTDLLVNLVESV
jgi:3-phenylpropionate/trans-cinnamate dioxygenase ferredoxin subunit